ncbi:DUF6115 domain-containing protein [Pseudalkalibacillus sp. SCS-8]|uniref:DUF6115 domain-containing protein n=1 Tax=Pseudalkalibacillus nanhaiensis TaxID=3115291 RepID=UPI0032D9F762
MTEFLLGVSFFIHLITILSIIVIWKKSEAAGHEDVKRMKTELEDILLAYTTEMKEENDAFIKELQRMNNSKESNGHIAERTNTSNEKGPEEKTPEKQGNQSDPIHYIPPFDDTVEEFGPSLLSQVLSLKDQNYSIDEIAKRVNKGKGEIELLIKFHQDRH